MNILDRLLITFIVWGALVLLMLPARAEPPQDAPITVTMTQQERSVVMQMCEAARWAARIQFDSVCEYFSRKFAAAEEVKQKPPTASPNRGPRGRRR